MLQSQIARNNKIKGFGLIESLIAMVIILVGVFLYASIQLNNLRQQRFINNQIAATMLIKDMANRIALNPDAHGSGSNSDYLLTNPSSFPNNSHSCYFEAPSNLPNGCTAQQIAELDIREWRTLANNLLGGSGDVRTVICFDSTPDDGEPTDATSAACDGTVGTPRRLTIKLWWRERNADNTESFRRVTTQVPLQG